MTNPNENKTVLIAWSGGLDSTYLIEYYLRLGYRVDVFNCYFKNASKGQMVREKKAMLKMLSTYFKNKKVNVIGSSVIDFSGTAFTGLYLRQVPTWIYNAINYVKPYHEKVLFGYVMNDDAVSFLDDITAIWKSYQPLFDFKLPELTYPLIKIKKSMMYYELPDELKKLITWCENLGAADNCGECPSCKRMSDLRLIDKNNFKIMTVDPEGAITPKKRIIPAIGEKIIAKKKPLVPKPALKRKQAHDLKA